MFFKGFGGPSKTELEGRKVADGFRQGVLSGLTPEQMSEVTAAVESGIHTATQAGLHIAIRDAKLAAGATIAEAERTATEMVALLHTAEKEGPAAVERAMAEIQKILDAGMVAFDEFGSSFDALLVTMTANWEGMTDRQMINLRRWTGDASALFSDFVVNGVLDMGALEGAWADMTDENRVKFERMLTALGIDFSGFVDEGAIDMRLWLHAWENMTARQLTNLQKWTGDASTAISDFVVNGVLDFDALETSWAAMSDENKKKFEEMLTGLGISIEGFGETVTEVTDGVVVDADTMADRFAHMSAEEVEALRKAIFRLKPVAVDAFRGIKSSAKGAANVLANKLYPKIAGPNSIETAFGLAESAVDKFVSALGRIPSKVTINLDLVDNVKPARLGRVARGRQHGGLVSADVPYVVGEGGEEVFVPDRSGSIASNKSLPSAEEIGAAVARAMHRVPLVVPRDAVTDTVLGNSPSRRALAGYD